MSIQKLLLILQLSEGANDARILLPSNFVVTTALRLQKRLRAVCIDEVTTLLSNKTNHIRTYQISNIDFRLYTNMANYIPFFY